jgi:hypothetical protein
MLACNYNTPTQKKAGMQLEKYLWGNLLLAHAHHKKLQVHPGTNFTPL